MVHRMVAEMRERLGARLIGAVRGHLVVFMVVGLVCLVERPRRREVLAVSKGSCG
jgi:hypothetical protein